MTTTIEPELQIPADEFLEEITKGLNGLGDYVIIARIVADQTAAGIIIPDGKMYIEEDPEVLADRAMKYVMRHMPDPAERYAFWQDLKRELQPREFARAYRSHHLQAVLDILEGESEWRPSLREGVSLGIVIGPNPQARLKKTSTNGKDPLGRAKEAYGKVPQGEDVPFGMAVLFEESCSIDYLGFWKEFGSNDRPCEIIVHGPTSALRLPATQEIASVPLSSILGEVTEE